MFVFKFLAMNEIEVSAMVQNVEEFFCHGVEPNLSYLESFKNFFLLSVREEPIKSIYF